MKSRRSIADDFGVPERTVRDWEEKGVLPMHGTVPEKAYRDRVALVIAGKSAGLSPQRVRKALTEGGSVAHRGPLHGIELADEQGRPCAFEIGGREQAGARGAGRVTPYALLSHKVTGAPLGFIDTTGTIRTNSGHPCTMEDIKTMANADAKETTSTEHPGKVLMAEAGFRPDQWGDATTRKYFMKEITMAAKDSTDALRNNNPRDRWGNDLLYGEVALEDFEAWKASVVMTTGNEPTMNFTAWSAHDRVRRPGVWDRIDGESTSGTDEYKRARAIRGFRSRHNAYTQERPRGGA